MQAARLLLSLLVCASLYSVSSAVSTAELGALTDLFYSAGGSGWYNSTGWLEGDPCDGMSWFGVDCSGSHVSGLFLSKNGLDGRLEDSIGDLYDLQELDLFGNELSGTLPVTISNLRDAEHLDVSHNLFHGTIPDSVGDLLDFSLSYIDFSHNAFTGFVPEFFEGSESSFQYVDLSGNAFFCPIPDWANYTRATCEYWDLTAVQPTCVYEGGSVVVYGSGFAPVEGVYCAFESEFQQTRTSLATVLSDNSLQCIGEMEFAECDEPDARYEYWWFHTSTELASGLYKYVTVRLEYSGQPITTDTLTLGIVNSNCVPGAVSGDYTIPDMGTMLEACNTGNRYPWSCPMTIPKPSSSYSNVHTVLDPNCVDSSSTSCHWAPSNKNSDAHYCPVYMCVSGSCRYGTSGCSSSSSYGPCYTDVDSCLC